jgi:cytochrome b involved in lipid metabolism
MKCAACCSIQIVYTLFLLPGRVYNVTHYMDFHPGGDAELMRGIGQDGTNLFNQVGSAVGTTRNVHKTSLENHDGSVCP